MHSQLSSHDAQEADERADCQRHRRDDARDAPCFSHVCGVGVENASVEYGDATSETVSYRLETIVIWKSCSPERQNNAMHVNRKG